MRIKKVSQTVPTTAQVVDGYSNSTTDSYSCNYVNKFDGTVLWTNTTPTSDFTAQQITLNSSDYDYLEIWFYISVLNNAESFCAKTEKGKNLRVSYFIGEEAGGYFGFRFRFVNYVNDTKLSISDCNQKKVNEQTIQTGNNWAIPYKVIGYKL